MIDRTQAPQYVEVEEIEIRQVEKSNAGEHDLFLLNTGQQEAVRLELVFNSGSWQEPRSPVARFAATMLKEGTESYSSRDIAEAFDSRGAYLEIKAGYDLTTLTVYALSRKLPELLPYIVDMIQAPNYPQEELEVMKAQAVQKHRIDLEKSSYVASSLFRQHLFGPNHPYGRNLREQDIVSINDQVLTSYHKNVIRKSKMDIYISGLLNDQLIGEIQRTIGPIEQGKNHLSDEYTPSGDKVQKVVVDQKDSMQSSLRIGKLSIHKSDPDYAGLLVANELLGGFFGSRLMKNIREDKGYTYGIYSQIVPMQHHTYFVIGSDVIKESRGKAIKQVKKEIKNLIATPPGEEELQTVKNYIIGSFQSELNTAFALTDKFKSVYYHGLDYDYYTNLIDVVRSINPEEISELARKHFNPDDLLTVAVG